MAINPSPNNQRTVEIDISLKTMYKAYEKLIFRLPVEAMDACVSTMEKLSTRSWMRTGYAAAVGVPLSIMLRTGAQGANFLDKGGVRTISSFAGGIGGWIVAGHAAAGMLATVPALAGVPAAATFVIAGVTTLPVLLPCIALSMIAIKMAGFTGGLIAGQLPAIINLPLGVGRTIDRIKGHKNMSYGENFSDGASLIAAAPEEYSVFKEPKAAAPVFNETAATTLDSDITYKKIKLKVKAPAVA